MTETPDPELPGSSALPPFATAIKAQQGLEAAIRHAGIDPSTEFPQMVADVNALGEPRIVLGAISVPTADRLATAISSGGTTSRR